MPTESLMIELLLPLPDCHGWQSAVSLGSRDRWGWFPVGVATVA